MMYFPYSLNSRNYARTGVIHQLSDFVFVFSAAHAAPSNSVFFRPTGSLQYWDMMTDQRTISGYQNWIDRYDVNGGMDLVSSTIFAALLGSPAMADSYMGSAPK